MQIETKPKPTVKTLAAELERLEATIKIQQGQINDLIRMAAQRQTPKP